MRTIIEAHDTIAEGQSGVGIKEKLLIQNDMTAASSGPIRGPIHFIRYILALKIPLTGINKEKNWFHSPSLRKLSYCFLQLYSTESRYFICAMQNYSN